MFHSVQHKKIKSSCHMPHCLVVYMTIKISLYTGSAHDIPGSSNTHFTRSQMVIITSVTAIICSLVFLILGMFLGCLIHHCFVRHTGKSSNPTPPAASAPVVYEEVSPDSHTGRKNDIELNENVAYGPVTK